MGDTLSIKPHTGTEAWIEQDGITTLMEDGWFFKVSGYDGEYCKVEIVGKKTNRRKVEEEEETEEETEAETFEEKVCETCGKGFGPEDYETETAAGKALGGHKTSHRRESEDEVGEENEEEDEVQTGLDALGLERKEETEA